MSTHNIGFCEDLTKIIFELSSNIIKYLISSADRVSHNAVQINSEKHVFNPCLLISEIMLNQ